MAPIRSRDRLRAARVGAFGGRRGPGRGGGGTAPTIRAADPARLRAGPGRAGARAPGAGRATGTRVSAAEASATGAQADPGEGGFRPGGAGGTGGLGGEVSKQLISYLKANRDGATWLVAVQGSQEAAAGSSCRPAASR